MHTKILKCEGFNPKMEKITNRGKKDRVHVNPTGLLLKKLTQRLEANSNPLRIALILHMFSTIGITKIKISYAY